MSLAPAIEHGSCESAKSKEGDENERVDHLQDGAKYELSDTVASVIIESTLRATHRVETGTMGLQSYLCHINYNASI